MNWSTSLLWFWNPKIWLGQYMSIWFMIFLNQPKNIRKKWILKKKKTSQMMKPASWFQNPKTSKASRPMGYRVSNVGSHHHGPYFSGSQSWRMTFTQLRAWHKSQPFKKVCRFLKRHNVTTSGQVSVAFTIPLWWDCLRSSFAPPRSYSWLKTTYYSTNGIVVSRTDPNLWLTRPFLPELPHVLWYP